METVLEVRGARHDYGATQALAGVDLDLGGSVALFGPNGAGKTMLVNLVVGLLPLKEGLVRVCGGDPRIASTRRRLGVVQPLGSRTR